jgi:hypothetical protein
LTFNGTHAVISQKIELFIATAVRTSNPTYYKSNYPEKGRTIGADEKAFRGQEHSR